MLKHLLRGDYNSIRVNRNFEDIRWMEAGERKREVGATSGFFLSMPSGGGKPGGRRGVDDD